MTLRRKLKRTVKGSTSFNRIPHIAHPKERSCESCRIKKVRCTTGRPACVLCLKRALAHGIDPSTVVCHYTNDGDQNTGVLEAPSSGRCEAGGRPLGVVREHASTSVVNSADRVHEAKSEENKMDYEESQVSSGTSQNSPRFSVYLPSPSPSTPPTSPSSSWDFDSTRSSASSASCATPSSPPAFQALKAWPADEDDNSDIESESDMSSSSEDSVKALPRPPVGRHVPSPLEVRVGVALPPPLPLLLPTHEPPRPLPLSPLPNHHGYNLPPAGPNPIPLHLPFPLPLPLPIPVPPGPAPLPSPFRRPAFHPSVYASSNLGTPTEDIPAPERITYVQRSSTSPSFNDVEEGFWGGGPLRKDELAGWTSLKRSMAG